MLRSNTALLGVVQKINDEEILNVFLKKKNKCNTTHTIAGAGFN